MTRTMKRHSTDLVSLVGGVIFLGVVGTWAVGQADLLGGFRGWLLPVLLIGVGLIGLIGIRPRRQDEQTGNSARSDGTADQSATDEPATGEPGTGATSADDEVKDT